MGGMPDELPEQYRLADPMAAIPLSMPVLCVHARADSNVPFAYSADYVEAARSAGADARLHEVAGDHFTVVDPGDGAWRIVVDALPRVLGR
jgi:pimeloyl-ACP methyl ester carboxylesterase